MTELSPPRAGEVAYVDHTSRSLARALGATLATFAEPRVTDPDRAVRLLGLLVESIAGFALGSIAGQLATGARTWFGDEAARAVRGALRRELRAVAPLAGPRVCYLDDGDPRPLVDELGARLHVRFGRAPIAAMVATTRVAIERLGPERIGDLALALDRACRDDLLEHRIGDALAAGWAQYLGVLAGARVPTTSPLWSAWSRKVCGEVEPARRDHPGYIMLVR